MSKVSFSDYIIISNAIVESQVDEGAIWDAIKTKLGGAASDDQLKAKRDDLKGKEASVTKAISKTKLSKQAQEAELRKQQREKHDAQWAKARTAAKTSGTKPQFTDRTGRGGEHAFARGVSIGEETFVISKKSRAPGKVSGLAGQEIGGIKVKPTYSSKKEAEDHAKILNAHGSSVGYEVSKLDELKQSTIRSYAQKARADQHKLIDDSFDEDADTKKLHDKVQKRQDGLNRAHIDKRYFKDDLGKAKVDRFAKVTEGQSEFLVTYTSKASGARGKGRIKGRDARDVRRKFGDLYFGKRLLSVEPVKAEPAKVEADEE